MQVCWRLWNSAAHIHIIYPYLARPGSFMAWHQGWHEGFFQLKGHVHNFPKHFWKFKNKLKQLTRSPLAVLEEQQIKVSFVGSGVVQCHPLYVFIMNFLQDQPEFLCSASRNWAAFNPGASPALLWCKGDGWYQLFKLWCEIAWIVWLSQLSWSGCSAEVWAGVMVKRMG